MRCLDDYIEALCKIDKWTVFLQKRRTIILYLLPCVPVKAKGVDGIIILRVHCSVGIFSRARKPKNGTQNHRFPTHLFSEAGSNRT